MSTSLATHCNAQYMFGVQLYRGITLRDAVIHRMSLSTRYSLHRVSIGTKIPPAVCEAGNALTPDHTRQLLPPTSSVIRSWSFLIAPQDDGQSTKTIPAKKIHPLGLEMVPLDR